MLSARVLLGSLVVRNIFSVWRQIGNPFKTVGYCNELVTFREKTRTEGSFSPLVTYRGQKKTRNYTRARTDVSASVRDAYSFTRSGRV